MGSIPVPRISTASATRTEGQMDKPTDGILKSNKHFPVCSLQSKPPDLWQTGDSHARSQLLLI